MDDDWKRKFPDEKRKFPVFAVPTKARERKKKGEIPEENKINSLFPSTPPPFWKAFGGVFAGIATAAGIYWGGLEMGEKNAQKQYPEEFKQIKQSLTISEEKNLELQGENKSLKAEIDMLKTKIEAYNSSSSNSKNDMAAPGEKSSEEIQLPESQVIGNSDTGVYFEGKLSISVISIDYKEDVYFTSISVSGVNENPKLLNDLKVGSKLEYETKNNHYEILISEINVLDVEITVNKLGK
ncbi:hypothetical protein [Mesobacillus zeae]|uniref:hypothetical protein n=1 Tax=Mesobacillus zeae TaxID=1917180 RepID=UPI003008BDEE